MKRKIVDWLLIGILAVVAINGGPTIILLCVIAGLLFLIVRKYVFTSSIKPVEMAPQKDNEFNVNDSEERGDTRITVDVDINRSPCAKHFCVKSRFELEGGRDEYEYRIDGTSVSARLLNSYSEGESTGFKTEWEVLDGVVLESDLRARWEAKQFKVVPIDEKVNDLKQQTEWKLLAPWSYNGFPYYLINRTLPVPDARRYLRLEIERLKLGNSRAIQEIAKYGLEPDPDPKSVDGWRWIGGQKREDVDTQPFWNAVKTGTFGVSYEELGAFGDKLILQLETLLGERNAS